MPMSWNDGSYCLTVYNNNGGSGTLGASTLMSYDVVFDMAAVRAGVELPAGEKAATSPRVGFARSMCDASAAVSPSSTPSSTPSPPPTPTSSASGTRSPNPTQSPTPSKPPAPSQSPAHAADPSPSGLVPSADPSPPPPSATASITPSPSAPSATGAPLADIVAEAVSKAGMTGGFVGATVMAAACMCGGLMLAACSRLNATIAVGGMTLTIGRTRAAAFSRLEEERPASVSVVVDDAVTAAALAPRVGRQPRGGAPPPPAPALELAPVPAHAPAPPTPAAAAAAAAKPAPVRTAPAAAVQPSSPPASATADALVAAALGDAPSS